MTFLDGIEYISIVAVKSKEQGGILGNKGIARYSVENWFRTVAIAMEGDGVRLASVLLFHFTSRLQKILGLIFNGIQRPFSFGFVSVAYARQKYRPQWQQMIVNRMGRQDRGTEPRS